MSTLYIPGDSPASWQNHNAGTVTVNDPWGPEASTFLPVSDYDAGRRDGIMIGLILGALSGSVIVMLAALIIW